MGFEALRHGFEFSLESLAPISKKELRKEHIKYA
jgi:hypothetical protein